MRHDSVCAGQRSTRGIGSGGGCCSDVVISTIESISVGESEEPGVSVPVW